MSENHPGDLGGAPGRRDADDTLRQAGPAAATAGYARIACCVDRDQMAPRVLQEALRLAGDEAQRLQVVHVVAPPSILEASPFAPIPPIAELTGEASSWLSAIARAVPDATTVLLDGQPARALCEWARASGADLIVAAAHRGGIARAVLGGFASYVAHRAPCPVLLVRHPTSEALPVPDAGNGATATP